MIFTEKTKTYVDKEILELINNSMANNKNSLLIPCNCVSEFEIKILKQEQNIKVDIIYDRVLKIIMYRLKWKMSLVNKIKKFFK